ncbi:PEP-CTERM sorting domain-containing protein [Pseudaquabacterium rugosum]|jgi:hypothetical protein|uniref:PEP-CTERM sorting domain-containing protein n=1 Tax=Pseudaquabacterium rugosum TaxID=2984194 RepID=A0ABU9BFK9_9BURK
MKSIAKFLGAAASLTVATMGAAHALPALPEPGTVSLVALGIAGVVLFSRRK